MSNNVRFLLQRCYERSFLICLDAHGIQSGFVQDLGNKAKDMSESAKDRMSDTGKAVADAAETGYDTTNDGFKKACDSVAKAWDEAKNGVSEKVLLLLPSLQTPKAGREPLLVAGRRSKGISEPEGAGHQGSLDNYPISNLHSTLVLYTLYNILQF
ncbi:hypothetical protein Y032_0603g532 [Ancylostoma ceylanicum]|uniref:Uncharacterized protein n=1 Tax=Ancylostoma ceylanicum TaxID=53326 RepID=A0A016WM39_9BILA|nr:hypothetical protein Y032_0603g532 [Ancylostoma ceylanicum]